jgi:cysteine desulfurase/selenocysteine lyase
MIEPLIPSDEFVGLDGVTHLCTGGEAPWLKSQEEVYLKFARLKSAGYAGRNEIYEIGEVCRNRMGELWHVPSDRVALVPAAAEGMSWLARGIDWKPGDNVVTTNLEFPSVAYAWKNLAEIGVEVRMVPHRDWRVHEEELLEAVDDRTRILAVSQVSFYTGQNLDLVRLSEAREKGALLAVDATHASGVVDVRADLTDLTVSSSYKWMLATHGVAPCYLSEQAENQTTASSFGWHNLAVWPAQGAERHEEVDEKPMPALLEPGNPAMQVVMHLERALERLQTVGLAQVESHAKDLSELVSDGLEAAGAKVISPLDRDARSGNTCFESDDAKAVEDRLAEHNVLAWGEFGRVRISTHVHNGSEDVERLLEVLPGVL